MPSGFSGAQVNLDMLLPLQPCSSLLSTGSALQCKTENFSRQRCKLTSVFLLLLPLLLLLLLYDEDPMKPFNAPPIEIFLIFHKRKM